MNLQVPFPILFAKENNWFVASCPILDITTQAKTEEEAKENIANLINDYINDPNTTKPSLEDLTSLSLKYIPITMPKTILRPKTKIA